MLVCVPGTTPVCGAGCDVSAGQPQADAYCTQVGTAVGTNYNTCVAIAGGLHICQHT
jgi:hypothetical protein